MKFNSRKLVIGLVLVTLLVVYFASTAFAAPHLNWQTTAVYYDDGQLIIKGYFQNDGTRTIDRINSLRLRVFFRQDGTDWWLAAIGSWYDFDVYLEPGDTRSYKLRIKHPNHYRFNYWYVEGSVNYHVTN